MIFVSWDFAVGMTVGLVVGLVSEFAKHVQDQGVLVLVTYALLGAALLAVVLAALAILVTLFADYFRQVVQGVTGGIDEAMLPYKIVAFIGGAGATVAMVGAIVWPALSHSARAAWLGAVTLLVVWAVAGTYQLVTLTIFFGAKRADLLEGVDAAGALLEQRRRRSA